MNRRGFLRAVGAAGLWLWLQLPAANAAAPRTPARIEKLTGAIRARQVLRFRYHGHTREGEPHALGFVTGGRIALLAWQSGGHSRSEPPPGWRTFVVAEMKQLRVSKKTFAPRPDYRAGRASLKDILVEVAP